MYPKNKKLYNETIISKRVRGLPQPPRFPPPRITELAVAGHDRAAMPAASAEPARRSPGAAGAAGAAGRLAGPGLPQPPALGAAPPFNDKVTNILI